jgi:serine/threonine-protein kinase
MIIEVSRRTELLNALTNRYRVDRELGSGGMATVYLAHDLKHDRKVALKVLKPELAAVLGADRFVQEIKTTASLSHPHILPLFDSGSAGGFLYYVMPYIEGETLRDKLNRETQLAVDEALRIATEVADALDYAHRRGVIHRDIKPENILLHDGRPMVADFGIALAVSAAAGGRMTETGLSLGTPHYMSPEQATADKEITGRSDIYSLASVLYETLAGQPPHLGGSAQQIIMKIIVEPVEPVTKFRKTVPGHVAAAIAKALEKLPADRYDSAKAFAAALANPALAPTALAPAAPALGGTRGVSVRIFALTVTTALAAAAVAAWTWLRPKPQVEVSRFSITLPDSQPVARAINGTRIALSPDGRLLAYVATTSLGRRSIYLRRLDRLTVEAVPGTENASNPAFSPDSRRLAFVAGEPRAIRVVSVSGGVPQTLTDSLVDTGGLTWSSDGYIYYDGHLEGDGLARIRETGGKPEIASRPRDETESWHSLPSALPNGRGVLFSVARLRGAIPFDIAVLDSRTGQHRVLMRGMAPRYTESGHLVYALDNGSIMAVRFDLERLTTSGDPVVLATGIPETPVAALDLQVSSNLLVYLSGSSGDRERELIWVARDGKVTNVHPEWKKPILFLPALSPDGRSVAVGVSGGPTNYEVWVKRLDRGPASKLADIGLTPTWLPNGTDVAFWSTGGIHVGPADGRVLPRLTFPRGSRPNAFEYSPDGQWLILSLAGDLVGLRTTGDSAIVPLVVTSALERRGTVSPDGRWMAYESDAGGRFQVYVRPFPNAASAKWQISVDGGVMPRWSPDGRELFFMTETGDMYAVPVTSVATFSAGTPRLLFNAPFAIPPNPFAVHPDGKRFLMTRGDAISTREREQLVVVQNYAEELRAKLP